MVNTGIIRKMDSLGRIVIAIEIRKNIDLKEKDPVEIFVRKREIVIRPLKKEEIEDISKVGGIVRYIDELGRIVIPIEIRNQFNIEEGDEMELYLDENYLVYKKVENSCVFCNEKDKKLFPILERLICKKCKDKILKKVKQGSF